MNSKRFLTGKGTRYVLPLSGKWFGTLISIMTLGWDLCMITLERLSYAFFKHNYPGFTSMLTDFLALTELHSNEYSLTALINKMLGESKKEMLLLSLWDNARPSLSLALRASLFFALFEDWDVLVIIIIPSSSWAILQRNLYTWCALDNGHKMLYDQAQATIDSACKFLIASWKISMLVNMIASEMSWWRNIYTTSQLVLVAR